MGQQGIERREMLQLLAAASTAGKFKLFDKWAFACNHDGDSSAAPGEPKTPYQPQFFTPEEFKSVERLAELIIPNDGKPGAREAGVAEFIDFMVANSVDVRRKSYQPQTTRKAVLEYERIPDALQSQQGLQYQFRYGVNWIEAHSRRLFGRPFLECSEEQQTEMLEHLAYKDRYREGEEDGRNFFKMMRQYTVSGFYTTRTGLEQLDFKGLQVFWTEKPECPHKDDPEHRHLPPPID